MRTILLSAVFAVLAGTAFAQDYAPTAPPAVELPEGSPPSALLPALVEHSRRTMRLENGRLTGAGADFLRSLGAQSQFVLIGEEHGNAGIAHFAEAYWRDLNEVGFNYGAIEVDPWVADAFTREVRAGGVAAWTRFASTRGGAIAAPFVTWAPEAQYAATIVETSNARQTPLWGLDQVFLTSAPWLLRDIATNAHGREARTMAAALADAGAGRLDWFPAIEESVLTDLRAHLNGRRDAPYAEMVDAMVRSRRIFRPFSGHDGEVWLANRERENLMKQNFLARYRAAERADGGPPRVMLKFGGYHMYRGPTPTHVMGLGGFVTELAAQNGREAFSVYVACGPGGFAGNMAGAEACDAPFAESYSFLAPYVSTDEITVFDLRAWKLRPRRWEHLSADARQLINSFDVLVVVPNGPASQFLEGLPPPQFDGN